MSIPTETIIPEIDEIVNFYRPESIEQIAKDKGFVQRESALGGIEFFAIMTYGLFSQPDASLNQMVAMLKDINPQLEITASGLHQRINQSGVEYLKEMFSEALELSVIKLIDESIPKLLEHFEKVHLLDSTQTSLPEELSEVWKGSGGDSSESALKIQLMLDYKSGTYESIVLTDGIDPDQGYIDEAVKLIGSKELLIDDLGYSKQEAMMNISDKGSYFLSRHNHRTNLYMRTEDNLVHFDIVQELKKSTEYVLEFCEFAVWFSKGERQLKMRLIAERVPEYIAAERRRKADKIAKKKGRTPTEKHLFLLGWNLYITNIESEILDSRFVRLLYSLRWQIELVFKSWKSYNGLTEIKGNRPERIECFIYGRLILLTIMAFLSGGIRRHLWNTKKREASFMKIIRHFQVKASKALSKITDSLLFGDFLFTEFLEACRLCPMELRKRLSTAQKIRMIGNALS
jgi:Transposase DDE domain